MHVFTFILRLISRCFNILFCPQTSYSIICQHTSANCWVSFPRLNSRHALLSLFTRRTHNSSFAITYTKVNKKCNKIDSRFKSSIFRSRGSNHKLLINLRPTPVIWFTPTQSVGQEQTTKILIILPSIRYNLK